MGIGMFIVFEGTDGSGKTTIIDALPEYLEGRYEKQDIVYYHWRPCYIKSPNKDSNTNTEKIVTNPHEKPAYGKVVSMAKFLYFNLDYVLGYWFKIRKEIKSGKLVIFDRYFYDYYLDKARYRLNISDRTLDAFKWMIPQPDRTFLLVGDAVMLYKRKQEISVEEIQKQIYKIKRCKEKFANSVIIDVDKSIIEIVETVVKNIMY